MLILILLIITIIIPIIILRIVITHILIVRHSSRGIELAVSILACCYCVRLAAEADEGQAVERRLLEGNINKYINK